ncbi:MAG: TetR/AcrR family transcriptional regulator [Acidimicrobiales bacterium]
MANAEQDASGDEFDPDDPLREQLLAAASRVFASRGYYGTKIMDIVREAGLSSGAIYGRFNSKNELLTAAVVSATLKNASAPPPEATKVADFIVRSTADHRGPLTESEALQLEAFVAARHEPEVADALAVGRRQWRAAVQPFIEAALGGRAASPNIDAESLLYFLEALHLGLYLQRGAGMQPPEPEAWDGFIRLLVRSIAGSSPARPRRSRKT